MVTILDVARVSGVSTTTVSHTLNGTRPVADRTRERVLKAVDDLGYIPNQQARALVRARTQQLGIVLSILTHHYFAQLIHAIEESAEAAGYTLLLAGTREDPSTEERAVAALRSRRVDGLLVAPSPGAGPTLDRLARPSSTPTVLIDRSPDPRFHAVCSENTEPVMRLVSHLAGIGHRRIAMVSGLRGLTSSEERVEGYRLGLERSGLQLDPDLLAYGASDTEVTYAALDDLMTLTDPPTAIVAASNTMVVATVRALTQRGFRVPEDIAVVGFDDFEWADAFKPRLTTVAQDYETMGQMAVRSLLERIAGSTAGPRTIHVPATIQHRDSCGCGRPGTPL